MYYTFNFCVVIVLSLSVIIGIRTEYRRAVTLSGNLRSFLFLLKIILNFLRVTTLPTFLIVFVACLFPMTILGYDGWIFRKLFDEGSKKPFK